MLKLLLESLSYRVLPAANGREALTIAASNRIDLVLTDFNLLTLPAPPPFAMCANLVTHRRRFLS
jgi:CheY-like chemotaxis protein